MGAASATSGTSLVSINNSALFSTSTQSLSDTPSSAGDLRNWTVSFWVYLNSQTDYQITFSTETSGLFGAFQFATINNFSFLSHNSSGANHTFQIPTRAFRDTGWYNFVTRCSSTANDGTAVYDNMNISVWVNGEAQAVTSNPYNTPSGGPRMFSGGVQRIGAAASTTPNYYVAEMVYLDGQKQNANAFGQYDSTYKFWTPKSPAVIKELTFGTNGFYFDNTTNAQTDASGEGNNYTNNNSVTTSTHTPTNLHNLWNPLMAGTNGSVPSVGNTRATVANTNAEIMYSTLPFDGTGKYYAEIHCVTGFNDGGGSGGMIGVVDPKTINPSSGTRAYSQSGGNAFGYYYHDGKKYANGVAGATYGATFTNGDKIGIYVNGGTVYLAKNNTLQNSASEAEVTNGTTTNAFTTSAGEYVLAVLGAGGNNPVADLKTDSADWEYTPFAGFNEITTTKIASATTRTKSNLEEYFDTTLYEGNGAGQRVGKFLPFTNTFTVGKGALFDDGDTELTRTPSSDGNLDKWTFSTWVKFCNNDDYHSIFGAGDSGSNQMVIYRLSDGAIRFQLYKAASFVGRLITTRKFLDTSRWYNVVVVWNSGSSDSGERMRIFVDGVRITSFSTEVYPSLNLDGFVNDASYKHFIGNDTAALVNASDIYLAQTVLLDGTTVTNADNFGQVDTSTGRWIPKQITGLTMGTNGFFMDYAASGANLGDDAAGSIDYANDGGIQVDDTPTVNSNVWNPSESGFSGGTFTNGNRTVQTGTSQYAPVQAGLPISSGKWYTEVVPTAKSSGVNFQIGITKGLTTANTQLLGSLANDVGYYGQDGNLFYNGSSGSGGQSYGASYAVNDVIGMAIDFDANTITFYKNGASQGVIALPNTSTASTPYFIACNHYDNASNATFLLRSLSSDWTGSAPTDHLAIIQDNMPTGESYQTAWSWIKNRDATDNHMLFDRVRGIYNDVHSNEAAAQVTNVNTLQRFLNGGVQVGNDVQVNTANESYVAWNWYMEATGTGSSNTDGTINTTSTLVDTNLGMSISTYSGTGANATVGHGLGVTPQLILIRGLENTEHWQGFHVDVGPTKSVHLNTASLGGVTSIWFNNTAPTSSVFSLGTAGGLNSSGLDYVAYCFAPSQFTSIGSYEGNSNANGTFIPTVNSLGVPIQPAWFLHKGADTDYLNWYILDSVSQTYNVLGPQVLSPDTNEAAPSTSATYREADFVTGGIKIRGAGDQINETSTHIYMAFGTPIIDVDGRIITGF